MKHNFIENNLMLLSKQTIDAFLKEKKPADLIALYCFYYYTAKWQKTNQPKATIHFVMKGLKWGDEKIRKNKKILIRIGLVEDIKDIDKKTGKIKGWYIRLNYLWKQKNHPIDLPEGGFDHSVVYETTNALSAGISNALNAYKKIPSAVAEIEFSEKEEKAGTSETNPSSLPSQTFKCSKECIKCSLLQECFGLFWQNYPRHEKKADAEKSWRKLKPDKALIDLIIQKIKIAVKSEKWKEDNGKYIPHPTTWLNGRRWEDEIKSNLTEEEKLWKK